jgi:hypothetical protein
MDVSANDKDVFAHYLGAEIKLHAKKYLIVNEKDDHAAEFMTRFSPPVFWGRSSAR